MDKEKVLEQIKKLLARSMNNPFVAEAKACILKAQKLMAEHNLSMREVEDVPKEVIREGVTPYTKTVWWHRNLGHIIASVS